MPKKKVKKKVVGKKSRYRLVTNLEDDNSLGWVLENRHGSETSYWDKAETLRSPRGKILFQRHIVTFTSDYDSRVHETVFGIVYGYIVSEHQKAGKRVAKVRLLTPAEQKLHHKSLRRRIGGHPNFW